MSNLKQLQPQDILPVGYQCKKPWLDDENGNGGHIYKRETSKAVYFCEHKSRYVAVKFAVHKIAIDEIEFLQRIQQLLEADKNTNLARNFTPYIESGVLNTTFMWLSMEAIYPSETLGGLWENMAQRGVSCPQALPMEFFCQIHSALKFLHGRAGISHGDLNDGNIMVRYATKNNSPATGGTTSLKDERDEIQFVIIDFGLSRNIEDEPNYRADVVDFRDFTFELCERVNMDENKMIGTTSPELARIGGKGDWRKFKDAMRGEIEHGEDNIGMHEINELEILETKFGEFAKSVVRIQSDELKTFTRTMWFQWLDVKDEMEAKTAPNS